MSSPDVAKAIEEHVSKRVAAWEARVEKAEEEKAVGNALFKDGDFDGAAKHFLHAHTLNFTQPNYLSNMAAALLKLERYEDVEDCTTTALFVDPLHLKARYRRLQGRKARGLYLSAFQDAKALLRMDKNCAEAKTEIKALKTLMKERREEGFSCESDSEDDLGDDPNEKRGSIHPFSAEDWHYNHLGCLRGTECKFSHAEDDFSIRDRLGKNVCIFFLVNNCKFGAEKCNYSHSKDALPLKGWWNSHVETMMKAQELKALGQIGVFKAKAVEQRKTYWKITDPRNKAMEPTAKKDYGKGKAKAGGAGGPSKPSRKRGGPKEPYRKPPKNNPYSDYDGYDSDERAIYCGFSEYDFMELMSQGVKPWDSDAEDVLAVLNGDYY